MNIQRAGLAFDEAVAKAARLNDEIQRTQQEFYASAQRILPEAIDPPQAGDHGWCVHVKVYD